MAPESEFVVVVTVLPSESVVVATPVTSATRMPKEVLREVMLLPALSVVVTVVVAVAVVSAVQPDQVVQGAEEPQGPSVQPDQVLAGHASVPHHCVHGPFVHEPLDAQGPFPQPPFPRPGPKGP